MASNKSNRNSLLVPYIFLIMGILSIAVSVFSVMNTNSFLNRAIITEAQVIDLAYAKSDGTYAPILSYKTEDGLVKTVQSHSWSKPSEFSKGQKVKVAYLQSNYDKLLILSFWNKYLITVITGFLGIIFTVVGGVFVYFLRYKNLINSRSPRKQGSKSKPL